MANWKIEKIKLPLKYKWKTADYEIDEKINFIVTITNGEQEGRGEISVNHKFGEDEELILSSFDKFINSSPPPNITSIEELIKFVDDQQLPNSLRFGIESAFVHYLSKISEISVNELFGIKTLNPVRSSYSLPLMDPAKVGTFIKDYNLNRFIALKVKINGSDDVDTIKEVMKNYSGNIRLDANESFADVETVIKFTESLGINCPIEFLEQPLSRDAHDQYLYLFENSEVDIFADESLTSQDVTAYYHERFHGINVKLMKAGSYLRALKQIKAAKEAGMKIMLGCMVETSLGISSALNIASGVDYYDLDGFLFLKNDPFGLVSEEKGKLFFSHLQ